MLQITVPITPEGWDEVKEEFVEPKTVTLQLEHSLVSLSKWESKWCKPFLTNKEKTIEETLDYIKCMTLTQNVKPEVYEKLTMDNLNEIHNYINAPMSATTFSDNRKGGSKEVVTSELIYYWMFANGIPIECQKWHITRLINLIRIFGIKNSPPKKRSKGETARDYKAINAARRKQLGTKG